MIEIGKRKIKQGVAKKRRKEQQVNLPAPKSSEWLNMLTTIQPESLNVVSHDGWEEIELTVDSGAGETVVPEGMVNSVEVKEGPAAKSGVQYECANGERIPNLGEQKFMAHTQEGCKKSIRAQVCEVTKALLSVRRLVEAGNRVVFEEGGSYIEDIYRKERMYLQEKHGMYTLKVWTKGTGF